MHDSHVVLFSWDGNRKTDWNDRIFCVRAGNRDDRCGKDRTSMVLAADDDGADPFSSLDSRLGAGL